MLAENMWKGKYLKTTVMNSLQPLEIEVSRRRMNNEIFRSAYTPRFAKCKGSEVLI